MEIITLPVGQLQANCNILFDNKSLNCVIIDPGDDADYIERIISDHKLNPIEIIATHGHFDHNMAVLELKLAFNIPFRINLHDKFLIDNISSSAKHFIGIETGPSAKIDGNLKEKDKIKTGASILTVIETPGHTPGSVCLYGKTMGILFTGDTLFADGGIGRTDFSYSSHKDLLNSLKIIFRLPGKTQIYPGHGRSSTLEEEIIHHRSEVVR